LFFAKITQFVKNKNTWPLCQKYFAISFFKIKYQIFVFLFNFILKNNIKKTFSKYFLVK